MKKIIIISILLIFPSILFAADCAWLLWEYSVTELPLPVYPKEPSGSWSLKNALNSRNECLDALLREYFDLYELLAGRPENKDHGIEQEVGPKLKEDEIGSHCFQSFRNSESVSKGCKDVIIYRVMDDSKGVKSKHLRHTYKSKELFFINRHEFWCLPVGVDPKTIGNKY